MTLTDAQDAAPLSPSGAIEPFYADDWLRIFQGDCRTVLAALPADSVHAAVTSPPYWGLRAYGTDPQVWGGDPEHEHEWGDAVRTPWANEVSGPNGRVKNTAAGHWKSKYTGPFCSCGAWLGELGQEPSPDLFVAHLVEVFRAVGRVLRPDGLLFLNLGDTYAAERGGTAMPAETLAGGVGGYGDDESHRGRGGDYQPHRKASAFGLKHKDLVGIPWRTAFALQADGWWLRNAITWAQPNPMPESVTDRFTNSYEMVFMFAKNSTYYFDQDAVREPHTEVTLNRIKYGLNQKHPGDVGIAIPPVRTTSVDMDQDDALGSTSTTGVMGDRFANPAGRNRRDVWTIPTVPYKGAHYAVFPPKLVEPMLLVATSAKGACSICGAQWRRLTDKIRAARGDAFGRKDVEEFDHGQAGSEYEAIVAVKTIGWEATCEHPDASVVPAVVLDPFGGSGTLGMVAQTHGRRAILIDLNPEYLSQQLTRNAQIPLGLSGSATE